MAPSTTRRRSSAATAAIALAAVGVTVAGPASAPSAPVATTTSIAATPAVAPAAVVTAASGKVNRSSRAAVLAAYHDRVLVPSRVANSWVGSTATCAAGSTSAAYRNATLTAINWARGQAGISAVPRLDATYSARAQSAALMMQANGALSHSPSSSWRCWTSLGSLGASRSNLSLGNAGVRAVLSYLADPGAANVVAGHRRWLLYPRLAALGIGNTATANALYVAGAPLATRPVGTPSYYAWPTAGYFPRAAEPNALWSLSSSLGYSFRTATVRVTGPGGAAVKVTRYAPALGYADSTLVWRLAVRPSHTVRTDQSWHVTVSGIRTASGRSASYSYTVTLVS
jgi:hypothetical protein